jgi:hypothetical protein
MAFDSSLALKTKLHVEAFLATHHIDCDDHNLKLKQSFNEAWFSNMLAWLLDPKGSHGFGQDFLQGFLKMLAKKRSCSEDGYSRRNTFLKWGREGLGLTTSGLSLGNASAAREFFLAGEIGREATQGSRFCDVVIMDLDPTDGLFVVVENKLFTTNHRHQLEDYHRAVESRYSKAKIREYVYLTFHGFHPVSADTRTNDLNRIWLRCSWTDDVAELLRDCLNSKPHREAKELLRHLDWLKSIYLDRGESKAEEFRQIILNAAAYCLEEELNRLGEGRPGVWSITREGRTTQLVHSSNPKSPLLVQLLPTLSVAVQGHRKGKASFEKIVIPYGVNTDQVFNLLDIAAKDIYRNHFGDRATSYSNARKRRAKNRDCERKVEVKPLIEFTSQHYEALRVLFSVAGKEWEPCLMEI